MDLPPDFAATQKLYRSSIEQRVQEAVDGLLRESKTLVLPGRSSGQRGAEHAVSQRYVAGVRERSAYASFR